MIPYAFTPEFDPLLLGSGSAEVRFMPTSGSIRAKAIW
jgi:hypothetical protein